jgi:secreted trypsin-like serine protease
VSPQIFTNPRIISGENAPPNRYPYLVSLRSSLTDAHSCGGTLIAPNIVLTAAHCEGSKSVIIGLHRQSDVQNNKNKTFEEFRIREEIIHPLRQSINIYDHGTLNLNFML